MNNVVLTEHAKEYLRIDGDHEDYMIGLLVDSAIRYLSNAGVKGIPDEENELYALAVIMLVTNWYENREQVIGTVPQALSLGLQSIILQLKAGGLSELN